ncbi:MAG: superoxide dismutase [Planctomycetes bacterium]|nr:superoxide dismutase [Planctomycetota bacterium]
MINRRGFLTTVAAGTGASLIGRVARGGSPWILRRGDPIALPALPYEQSALQPVISSTTMSFHYGKHHAGYVKKLNAAIADTAWADMSLPEIITKSHDQEPGIFNNAAQIWNHTFYWNSMRPKGGGEPKGKLADLMVESFGSVDAGKKALMDAAKTQFGSGWAWLVKRGDRLVVEKTANADTPVIDNDCRPLLTIDVWELAYYLDYQNARAAYVEAWMDKLVNWDFAAQNLG